MPAHRAVFGQFVGEADNVLDVGSNIGDRAAVFHALGATVFAFEPQPACPEALRRRFHRDPSAAVIEAGLAASSGELPMSICGEATTISTFALEWKEGRFHAFQWDSEAIVPVTTLDQAIERYRLPDFMKIGVEGHEEQVLAGLSSLAGVLSFEFAKEFADKTLRCLRRLKNLGYAEFNIALGEQTALLFDEWVSGGEVLDHITSSDDAMLWGDVYARDSRSRV
ncbi:MAG: FkbM family methyltransferase [Actinomycetia bacterium]|nr:FkbM family methyltransferase [Actinomycetes bacterium]